MRLSTALTASASLLLFACPALGVDSNSEPKICANQPRSFARRDVDANANVGVDVALPSVGVSIGNITTILGDIKLKVTDVTIAIGDITIEDVHIGDISVIVSVPLPGASPISGYSTQGGGQTRAVGGGSSGSAGATTSGAPAPSSTAGSSATTDTAAAPTGAAESLAKRQATPTTRTIDLAAAAAVPTLPSLPDASVGVNANASISGGPINAGVGNIYTEIGNITITVDRVNVSVGNVKISNITIGNIFVYVQIGQADLAGAIGNLTHTLDTIGSK